VRLRHIRFRDPPLACDAFVDERLAIGCEGGDLSFDATMNTLNLG